VTPLGSVHVFDNGRRLKSESVAATGIGNHLIIRLPLRLLGDTPPDLLFASTHASLGEVASDDTAWHLFSLSNNATKRHTMDMRSINMGK